MLGLRSVTNSFANTIMVVPLLYDICVKKYLASKYRMGNTVLCRMHRQLCGCTLYIKSNGKRKLKKVKIKATRLEDCIFFLKNLCDRASLKGFMAVIDKVCVV